MKKKEYKTLVSDIAELLLRHDPIGLKAATDLPMDEYEAEAMAIAGGLRHCHGGDSCLALVVKIFRDSFGEAIAGPEESYERWFRQRVIVGLDSSRVRCVETADLTRVMH